MQHSIKEEDVWEDNHDASLPARGVVYADILHSMRFFNNVAQLRAPTGAHLATAQICYGHGCIRWLERRVRACCSSRKKL